MAQSSWILDPDDPRAPSAEQWMRMSEAERQVVVASLPTDMPLDLHPPEGDAHRKPKERARDALDEFFRSVGRRVYLSSELVTYYPGEARFCPDILAVLDVDTHERSSWIVSREGKGLDLVIEIHVGGAEHKDFETNVARYARLGIPEYFIFDRSRSRIVGHRLRSDTRSYERIVPQAGRLASTVLGLDPTVEGGLLRFYHGTAPLLFMDEIVGKLNHMVNELVEERDAAQRLAEEQARLAEEQARRAEEQARRAEELARENEALRAELDELRRKG